jgi:two-component system chemotaxis response regulator CheY
VASTITNGIRGYDWAGRWGGEEFIMVLPGTDHLEAKAIAERLRVSIAAAVLNLADGRELMLRASFGVASATADEPVSFDELIQRTDEALYCAKREGRNRVCAYEESKATIS